MEENMVSNLLMSPPAGTTSTSRCCRLSWNCTSSRTSTWSKPYGEQRDLWHKPWPMASEIMPPPLIAGSSCGASVCQAKPRRLTAWWRRLLHATASATLESFSRQVSIVSLTCFNDTICIHTISDGHWVKISACLSRTELSSNASSVRLDKF